MEDYRININYAKALFLVAHDMGQLDAANEDMRLVYDVCCENHILATIFANPVIREAKKVAILKELFEDKVSQVSMLFLAFVVRKRRSVNLKGIANAFVELYRNDKGIILSRLVTARRRYRQVGGEDRRRLYQQEGGAAIQSRPLYPGRL